MPVWPKNMASRFRTCVALSAAFAIGILLVAARLTGLISPQRPEALEASNHKAEIEAPDSQFPPRFPQFFADTAGEETKRGQSARESPSGQNHFGDSRGYGSQSSNRNDKSHDDDVTTRPTRFRDGDRGIHRASPTAKTRDGSSVDKKYLNVNVASANVGGREARSLRDCVTASKVFSDDAEVDALVRVLEQFRDMTPPPDDDGKLFPPLPLVFTQMRKGEGVGIAEAFHHAWSVALGCGKIFFTRTDVRVRQGKEKCFSLFASAAAPHLYPWGFFDSATRKQKVPDLDKIIGIRGNLPFGACRFLDSDCSYTTVLLEPVERYISHVQPECLQRLQTDQSVPECDLSLQDFTHAAVRGDVSFYGIDNYQTRLLAGDGSVDSNNKPCFSAETCKRVETFQVGPSDVKAAIRNLVFHYPVWGVVDDLPSFADRLQRVYGYPFFMLKEKRTTTDLDFGMNLTLDATARKEIEQMNAADVTLYTFARCVLDAGSPRFAF